MAGVVPVVPPRTGSMNGKLYVETERFLTFDELYTHVSKYKTFFDELDKKGLRYLLIDSYSRVSMELDIVNAPYTWQSYEAPRGGFAYKLNFDFGRRLPMLNLFKVISLDRCIINICSQDYARAVTIDLIKNEVTYVHDSLWILKGEGYPREARDVLSILSWLIEGKKFKLTVSGGEKYYRELVTLVGGA
jgi:hypothetical protein